MKLHQLRYLAAVVQNGLNITTAARKLHTSQPGVSKQLKLLEDELGFPLFERDGRNLTGVTAAGQQVVDRSLRILEEVQNIRRLSADLKDDKSGSLAIGTTHTQARYVLPPIVQRFRAGYADVDLHLHQGSSEQIAELAKLDRIDVAIATGGEALFPGLVLLPCYRWHRRVIVPREHPLAGEGDLSLKTLARYPIVTYTFSFSGRSSLPALFESAGLKLKVALTASDADVIKTYVRLGLGVGIVASVALEPQQDADLVVLDASHLFPLHTTWIGFRRGWPDRPAAGSGAGRRPSGTRTCSRAAGDRAGSRSR
ncbi:MAG TPA: LysR substrate-binding domain-containing protein [Steroidobacteraceae bacterium]|nr:LysR substrate-binding domain-containing protein [Steroidobacteraceae bacterium]